MSAALQALLGAVLPLPGWWLLRRIAGTRGTAMAAVADAAPALVLWLLLIAAMGRPVLAGALVLGALVFLAVADHTKRRTLGEPLVFTDGVLLPLVVRHPGLYLPFVGLPIILGGFGTAAIAFGLLAWLEPPLPLGAGTRLALALSALALAWPLVVRPRWLLGPVGPKGDPATDARRLGPLLTLALHRAVAAAERPTRQAAARPSPARLPEGERAPHLVVVQMESFCDPRRLPVEAPSGLLPRWDALSRVALARGVLDVPGFGANTMRAEFAVLTGLSGPALGLERFNPYARFARRPVTSLAWALRGAGYTTACVHPFDARFFGRDRVLPALGFERFIDGREFHGAQRAGQHIADAAVAARLIEELRAAQGPAFLYAITMQAHGPWHGPDPLGIWLGHMRDADAMLGAIADAAAELDRPVLLVAYGDHRPALPQARSDTGTDYLIWRSDRIGDGLVRDTDAAGLHRAIRKALGCVDAPIAFRCDGITDASSAQPAGRRRS